jgi:2-methylcitrate dehydratase PrpD
LLFVVGGVFGVVGLLWLGLCAASAIVFGHLGVETFDDEHVHDDRVRELMSRVHMRTDPSLDGVAAALTQARVTLYLRDGRVVSQYADGARGYPTRPARPEELEAKFTSCARRVLSDAAATRALGALRQLEALDNVRTLLKEFVP